MWIIFLPGIVLIISGIVSRAKGKSIIEKKGGYMLSSYEEDPEVAEQVGRNVLGLGTAMIVQGLLYLIFLFIYPPVSLLILVAGAIYITVKSFKGVSLIKKSVSRK